MPRSERLHDILSRLAAAEERVLAREILAPMVRGGCLYVRIDGIVCRLIVEPPLSFEGWGIFRATSASRAVLARSATLTERRRYLELLPSVQMILASKQSERWLAIPANQADRRFRFKGWVAVNLVEDAQLFEVVRCRFDGARLWYEGPDTVRDPATASFLRARLAEMADPTALERPGLRAEERTAYALALESKRALERDRTEERLSRALSHAGALFTEYQEHGDVYRVAYEVDGRRHVSVVDKRDLSVQVAGICLSGQDRRFDLQSMVSVLREASGTGMLLPIGDEEGEMPEELYREIHPPDD